MGMMDLMFEQIGRTYGPQLENFAKQYAALCAAVARIQKRQLEFAIAAGAEDPKEAVRLLVAHWQSEDETDARRNSDNSGKSAG